MMQKFNEFSDLVRNIHFWGSLIKFKSVISRNSSKKISLQEAAQIISDKKKISEDSLQSIPDFFETDPFDNLVYKRDNPDKVHKETLPECTTQPLINLCLHLCQKKDIKIYGIKPSSSYSEEIPFERIEYFDSAYERLYSDNSRENIKLIYTDIVVKRKDLLRVIKNTDLLSFIKKLIHPHDF